MDQCYIFPSYVNPKFWSITRTFREFISHVRAKLLTLWKYLVCQKRGIQKMSFLLTVLQISMVLCKVHISNPWRKLVYHLDPSSVHSRHLGMSCLLPYALQQGRSSWDREDRGRYVLSSFPPLSFYSRISGRDSCKGGRFVTAPVWYCKIRTKFSLLFSIISSLHHGIHT